MRNLALVTVVVLAFLPIQVLFAGRIWVQVTSEPTDSPEIQRLFSITDDLASPVAPLAGGEPMRTTGVIDYTVLVAMEVYFIAMLLAIGAILMANGLWAFLKRFRHREIPAFVHKLNQPRRERRLWQLHAGSRRPRRFYMALTLVEETPVHRKAGLGPQ